MGARCGNTPASPFRQRSLTFSEIRIQHSCLVCSLQSATWPAEQETPHSGQGTMSSSSPGEHTSSTDTLLLFADQRSWQKDTCVGQKRDGMPSTHVGCGLVQGGALRKRKYEGCQQTVTPVSEHQKTLEELHRSSDHTFCPVVVRLLQPISGIDTSFSGLPHHNKVICHGQAACLHGFKSM